MAGIDLQELTNNPDARVMVVLPDRTTVTGFLTQEFSFGGRSKYESAATADTQGRVSKIVNNISSFVGGGEKRIAQIKLMHPNQTVMSWQGTTNPDINLNLVFISLRENQDLNDTITQLQQALYPTVGTGSIAGKAVSGIYKAPGGYSIEKGIDNPKAFNTNTVSIGRWFLAPGLVMTALNFTISKEPTSNRTPLYVGAAMSFSPFKQVDYATVKSYFKKRNITEIQSTVGTTTSV